MFSIHVDMFKCLNRGAFKTHVQIKWQHEKKKNVPNGFGSVCLCGFSSSVVHNLDSVLVYAFPFFGKRSVEFVFVMLLHYMG